MTYYSSAGHTDPTQGHMPLDFWSMLPSQAGMGRTGNALRICMPCISLHDFNSPFLNFRLPAASIVGGFYITIWTHPLKDFSLTLFLAHFIASIDSCLAAFVFYEYASVHKSLVQCPC